jgi:hypothetical protein
MLTIILLQTYIEVQVPPGDLSSSNLMLNNPYSWWNVVKLVKKNSRFERPYSDKFGGGGSWKLFNDSSNLIWVYNVTSKGWKVRFLRPIYNIMSVKDWYMFSTSVQATVVSKPALGSTQSPNQQILESFARKAAGACEVRQFGVEVMTALNFSLLPT